MRIQQDRNKIMYIYFEAILNKVVIGELSFILLPIAVYSIISFLVGKPNAVKLGLSSEFAFANIMIAATALTNFIQLKTEFQKDTSDRLYSGIRIVILLVIFSLIIYTLLLLNLINTTIQAEIVQMFQYGNFILSVFMLGASVINKTKINSYYFMQPKTIYFHTYKKLYFSALSRIQCEIGRINYLSKYKNTIVLSTKDNIEAQKDMIQLKEKIQKEIIKIQNELNELRI